MVLANTGPLAFSQIQTEFGGTNPVGMSEYYTNANPSYTSGVSGLPATGSSMALSAFLGKAKPAAGLTINAPSGSIFTVSAYSLSNLSSGAKVASWSNFSQSTSSLQPTYQSGTSFPYVQFTGTSSTSTYLSATGTSLNFNTGGGSTVIVLGRYNSLVQYNRTVAHTGGSGSANTFEWIMAENPAVWNPKYFFVNSSGVPTNNSADVPLNKVSLYVARWSNAATKAEIFRNNTLITSKTHAALPNSTTGTFYIGAQGGAPGANMDMIYAAYYTRALTDTELTTLYNSVSSICQN